MSTGIQLRQISSHVKMVRLSISIIETEGYNLSTTLPFSIILFLTVASLGDRGEGGTGQGPCLRL